MKISYQWERGDVKCGMYVSRNHEHYGESVTYKIGKVVIGHRHVPKVLSFYSLAAITDGLTNVYTEQELLDHLNSDRFGYKPTPHDEVVKLISGLKSCNEVGV